MPVVKVNPPSVIKVRVGNGITPKVSTINYGISTLSHLSDVNMSGAGDGDVIVYQANTNTFVVEDFFSKLIDFDAGFF